MTIRFKKSKTFVQEVSLIKINRKIETPFYVPFMSTDCEFFPEVKDDLIQIIMEKHEEKPFELQ